MTHIDFTVFAFQTEIMGATTVTITVSLSATVMAISNAVTLVNVMACLTVPVAYSH